MNKNLYILTLEPLEQRYTKQWHKYFKKEFSKSFNVKYIDGIIGSDKIKKGKFLDINKTNIWKAEQVIKIANLFNENKIKKGDIFFIADGWHYGITALKYMSQLNDIPIKIFAYWHAATWDDNDFITQAGLRSWAPLNEAGWLCACDGHFVATQYHKDMIVDYFNENEMFDGEIKLYMKDLSKKIHVVGFPMDWEKEINGLISKKKVEKEDIVVFPHRLDKEKCPEVFDELASLMPEYKFIKTLEVTKNKKEYYELLKKAKIIFSASAQETFGIGTVEAMCLGALPVVTNKLSYLELYNGCFRYTDIDDAKRLIHFFMKNYDNKKLQQKARINIKHIKEDSLDSINKMAKVILNE